MKLTNFQKILLLGLHVALGVAASYSFVVSSLWGIFFFFYSIDRIIRYRNSDNWAFYACMYIMGLDIVFRISNAFIFSEFSKYSIVFFAIFGMIAERRYHKIWWMPLTYFILLLPSIIMMTGSIDKIRECLSFNLSGPIAMAMGTIYTYNRKMTKSQLMNAFFLVLMASVSAVIIIILRLPDFSKIGFNLSSNKDTSGGFGPDQVSTALGFGFMLVAFAWLIKEKITSNPLIDRAIGFVLISYAVLTFARGGVVTPILVMFMTIYIYTTTSGNIRQFFRVIQLLVLSIFIGSILWVYLDALTNNALGDRYQKSLKKRSAQNFAQEGVDNSVINTDLSGREFIATADLKIFASYPILGVGPGMAKDFREKYIGFKIAAHTEFTRLIAEHGLYGIAALLLTIFMPVVFYRTCRTPEQKALLFCFTVFSLATSVHSATRLSITVFSYAIGFLNLVDDNPLARNTEEKAIEEAEEV